MSWSASVDAALCFGWIDGVRKSIDENRYCIRFSPRKPSSIWSAINIQKVEELTNLGLMEAPGLRAFEKRMEHKSRIYSYEAKPMEFSEEYQKEFKSQKTAWAFFQNLAPSYRRTATNWVMSAKQEKTRKKRLQELIEYSLAGKNKWKNLN